MPIRLVIANLAVKWGREFEPITECLTRAGQPEAHAYHALLNFGCSLIGRHADWVFLKCGGVLRPLGLSLTVQVPLTGAASLFSPRRQLRGGVGSLPARLAHAQLQDNTEAMSL